MDYNVDNAIMDLMFIHRKFAQHINEDTVKNFDACVALSITALQEMKNNQGDEYANAEESEEN